jgi:hypothetical protein
MVGTTSIFTGMEKNADFMDVISGYFNGLVWDHTLLEHDLQKSKGKETFQRNKERFLHRARHMVLDPQGKYHEQAKDWIKWDSLKYSNVSPFMSAPLRWAKESNRLNCQGIGWQWVNQTVHGDLFMNPIRNVLLVQILKAALRTAHWLKMIFE